MTVTSFLEFRSRIDRTMAWLMLGSCVVLLVFSMLTLMDKTSGPLVTWLVFLVTIVFVPLLLWFLMGTSYRLTDTHLLIRSGPLKKSIILNEIMSVEPVRSLQRSPALSRDRFLIRYNQSATVMVSPLDRGQFLNEVATRASHLIWQNEKLVTIS